MSLKETMPLDYVGWARRANACWIVHHDLGRNAASYIDHLEQGDRPRLISSCRNAYRMVWRRDSMEDPKPWFYSGLFSLVTASEAEKFLANHWLTQIATATSMETSGVFQMNVSGITLEKIRRIQKTMAKLPGQDQGSMSHLVEALP